MKQAAHRASRRRREQHRVFRMAGPASQTGDRPTYLLLHGIGLSHRSFTPLAKALSASGDTIAPDLPGYGATPTPDRPISVEQYAASIASVVERTAGGPVVVVGHSMGAQFALELAITRPDLVESVVLAGPVVDPRWDNVAIQGALLAADALTEPMATKLMAAHGYVRTGLPWFLTETREMLEYDTHERIGLLRKPLLVIRGEYDTIANEGWTEWLASQVAGGASRTFKGHSHNVIHSGPAEVAEAIVHFSSRSERQL
ncbi:alpha/beta hydrolase [Salinibacterium sp. G-O1]|uniref:alpha/beta fold hydrolase n=1 Tax=Salinibacterium sp. G-O1 TaxID=3046208 RepID=UPI0024BBCCB2|nr:alpha/beta hydrolase [Salinibacterium sp. G-O1]MDJ0333937.1 alpha/beta hydrolase [Salinibacterium sp. G-O1]